MPLVLHPNNGSDNIDSLVSTLKKNKDWFEQMIIKNSAVLLRGFHVKNAEDFNEIIEAFDWDDIRYVGPAPRTHIYKRIWTANEGPLEEFIYYHHEMVLVSEIHNLTAVFLLSTLNFFSLLSFPSSFQFFLANQTLFPDFPF